MSRAIVLRSLLAPDEAIEADLVDQLADASDEIDRLRSRRPEEPDIAWSRHYALLQTTYTRILDRLARLRKSSVALRDDDLAPPPAALPEIATPPASSTPTDSRAPLQTESTKPAPSPVPLNRHDRRRLEALRRSRRAPADRLHPPPPPLRYLSPSNPAFVSAAPPVSGPRSPGGGSNATARPTP